MRDAKYRRAPKINESEIKLNSSISMKQVCVKNFRTEIEAELAQNMLEARGIKSVIQPEGFAVNGGVAAAGVLGVDLFVLEKDLEEAKGLLDQK